LLQARQAQCELNKYQYKLHVSATMHLLFELNATHQRLSGIEQVLL